VDKSSYDVGVFTTTPEFIKSGKEKVARALEIYREYFVEGRPLSTYIIRGEL